MWVVWTAASRDCFHPLVCPNPFSYSCCAILYTSSLAHTAQYCSCVTVCMCSLHMHSVFCRLSNSIVLHSVQLCFHYHCGMCSSMHAGMD